MIRPIEIVILAAGAGSRMRSGKPKVLQTLGGEPLLHHILNNLLSPAPLPSSLCQQRKADAF